MVIDGDEEELTNQERNVADAISSPKFQKDVGPLSGFIEHLLHNRNYNLEKKFFFLSNDFQSNGRGRQEKEIKIWKKIIGKGFGKILTVQRDYGTNLSRQAPQRQFEAGTCNVASFKGQRHSRQKGEHVKTRRGTKGFWRM